MKKTIALITVLFSTITLVACNGSTSNNASDVSSPGSSTVTKAVCTSLNNWQSVGLGMSATQVEERLGKPAKIISNATSTQYRYEACRGFVKVDKEGTATTATTYVTTQVEGVVVISGARGVTATTSPERITDAVVCELDYYRYPEAGVRTSSEVVTLADGTTETVFFQSIPSQYCRDPAKGTQF